MNTKTQHTGIQQANGLIIASTMTHPTITAVGRHMPVPAPARSTGNHITLIAAATQTIMRMPPAAVLANAIIPRTTIPRIIATIRNTVGIMPAIVVAKAGATNRRIMAHTPMPHRIATTLARRTRPATDLQANTNIMPAGIMARQCMPRVMSMAEANTASTMRTLAIAMAAAGKMSGASTVATAKEIADDTPATSALSQLR